MAEFKEITSSQELKEILEASCQRKIILFKHSTACPVSAHAWQEVQDYIQESSNEVLVVMIKVIESRPVSNQVAEEFGVKHQSPQALLINDRKVLWHASHQIITKNKIIQALKGDILPFNLSI